MKGKIYRRKNSCFFYADYTLANGKRRRVSTGEETREKAELFLHKLKETDHFTRQKRNVRKRALRAVSEMVEINTGEALKDYTVRQWMNEWVAEKMFSRAGSTGARYGQAIRDFLSHLESRADDPLEMLSSSDLRSFWEAERATGKSKETVRLAINVVRAALVAAERKALIDVSPGADFEEETITPETAEAEALDRNEKGLFTADEAAALLVAADGDWKNMIRLAYYVGMRLGDCLNLRWKSVDLEAKCITFMPRKTARLKTPKVLTVPMHPDLLAAFSALPGVDGPEDALVCPNLGGRSNGGPSKKFRRIMRAAGIEAGILRKKQGAKGRTLSQLSFHSFRHGYITSLEEIGASVEQRQELAGHGSPGMTRRYTHIKADSLRPFVDKLPGLKVAGEEAGK